MLRSILKIIGFLMLIILLVLMLGPRENTSMPDNEIIIGDNLNDYLANSESAFNDITPGAEKQILWVNDEQSQTPFSIVYMHGFSATHKELAPLPQELAKSWGANLYLSRLKGHGRSGEALAEASAQDWLNDLREALLIGEILGEKTILLTASTGGTLAAIASQDQTLREEIDGIIFVSPNFAINNSMAPLLTLGAARHWVPLIGGQTRSWEPANEEQGKYWTTSYPSKAVFPVAALVKETTKLDYEETTLPAFFFYSSEDTVVDAAATDEVASKWGGNVDVYQPKLTDNDDPSKHIIAGDILSPDQTPIAIEKINEWFTQEFSE